MQTTLKTYYNVTKEKLKAKFPVITNEDLDFREGRERDMMEMLARKLELSYEDLIRIIESL